MQGCLKSFARRLYQARLGRGWWPQTLAAAAGLDPARVAAVESGASPPSLEEACDLAVAVGESLEWLLALPGSRPRSPGVACWCQRRAA
jgi:transcriptional regulator with XRE-family HTH domain